MIHRRSRFFCSVGALVVATAMPVAADQADQVEHLRESDIKSDASSGERLVTLARNASAQLGDALRGYQIFAFNCWYMRFYSDDEYNSHKLKVVNIGTGILGKEEALAFAESLESEIRESYKADPYYVAKLFSQRQMTRDKCDQGLANLDAEVQSAFTLLNAIISSTKIPD